MATHESVVGPTGAAKAPADIVTGIGTITGVTADGHLGADGVTADEGVTDRPMMGIVGAAVTIDDATYVDPEDGTVGAGAALNHTLHYPGTNPAFRNEGEVRA